MAHQCDCVLISLSCVRSAGSTHCLFFVVLFSYLQPAQVTRFDLSYPGLTAANYLASLSFYFKCLWLYLWLLHFKCLGCFVSSRTFHKVFTLKFLCRVTFACNFAESFWFKPVRDLWRSFNWLIYAINVLGFFLCMCVFSTNYFC